MKTLKFKTQHGTCEIVPAIVEGMPLFSNGISGNPRKVFTWSVYLNSEPVSNWLYNLTKEEYKTFQDWRDKNKQQLK